MALTKDQLQADTGLSDDALAAIATDDATDPGNAAILRNTEPHLLECLNARQLANHGCSVGLADLINFYLSLKQRGFVILTGISGTGKSRLPRLFAELIAPPAGPADALFESVPIR